MIRKSFLILLIFGIVILSGCIQQPSSIIELSSIDEIHGLEGGQKVKVTGIVKTGLQIGTDYHLNYCYEPHYIVDDSGYIQLTRIDETGFRLQTLDEIYLGKKVEIIGKYVTPVCAALCICDDNILVESIKIVTQ